MYSGVHEDMGGKGSTQESALSLGDQKDSPIRRREELTQTKGRCDSPEELTAVPVRGLERPLEGLVGGGKF